MEINNSPELIHLPLHPILKNNLQLSASWDKFTFCEERVHPKMNILSLFTSPSYNVFEEVYRLFSRNYIKRKPRLKKYKWLIVLK